MHLVYAQVGQNIYNILSNFILSACTYPFLQCAEMLPTGASLWKHFRASTYYLQLDEYFVTTTSYGADAAIFREDMAFSGSFKVKRSVKRYLASKLRVSTTSRTELRLLRCSIPYAFRYVLFTGKRFLKASRTQQHR